MASERSRNFGRSTAVTAGRSKNHSLPQPTDRTSPGPLALCERSVCSSHRSWWCLHFMGPEMTFDDLGLAAPLLQNVTEEGYTTPTPIQEQAIPQVIAGKDLLGCAQTGTGKTAAFALPMLHRMMQQIPPRGQRRRIRGLVLSPTRELAAQIGDSLRTYGRNSGVFHTVIFGGVNQYHQVRSIDRGIDILVATPGRLLDLIGQGFIQLDAVEFFVLDEADRMLDMGFMPDIERVIPMLPENRQTLFFSATMPAPIRTLADTLLKDPAKIEIEPVRETTELIDQSVCFVDAHDKSSLLVSLIRSEQCARAVVFARTKMRAERVVRKLQDANIPVDTMHSDKSQAARQRALYAFKSNQVQVLVATDIAARGLDVDNITHVFNYDMPGDAETYVHRIGRTGRAGARGTAISFVARDERRLLSDVQFLLNQRLPLRPLPQYMLNDEPRRPFGMRDGEGAAGAQNPEGTPVEGAVQNATGDQAVAPADGQPADPLQSFAPNQFATPNDRAQFFNNRGERGERGHRNDRRPQYGERRPYGQDRRDGGFRRDRASHGEPQGGGGRYRDRGPRDGGQRGYYNDGPQRQRYGQPAIPPDSIAPVVQAGGPEGGQMNDQSLLYVRPDEAPGYAAPGDQGGRNYGGPRRNYFAGNGGPASVEGGQNADNGYQSGGVQYGRRQPQAGQDQGEGFWPKRRRENDDQQHGSGRDSQGGYRQERQPGYGQQQYGGGRRSGNGGRGPQGQGGYEPRGDRRQGGYGHGGGYRDQQAGGGNYRDQQSGGYGQQRSYGGGYQQGQQSGGQREQQGGGYRQSYGQGGGYEQGGRGGYGRAPFRKKFGGSAPRYS